MALFEALFNVGSDTALEAYTPDTGTGFTLVSGTASTGLVVSSSNTLQPDNATGDAIYYSDNLGSADNYIEIKLDGISNQYTDSFICTRFVDADNFVGIQMGGLGAAGFRLIKKVAGVSTTLISTGPSSGDIFRIEVEGTDVKFFKNTVQVGSTQTVTDFSTETSQGFYINNSNNTQTWVSEYRADTLGSSGITITLDSGSYSVTGTDIILIDPPADETITIDAGSYSISGTNVNLIADYKEIISSGAYTYTGTDVILIDPIVPGSITIDSGSYSVSGALIQTSINTPINTDSYAVTGTAINFAITRGMTIDTGSYIIQGTNINFSNTGNIWTDKPSVVTLWGDKTPVTTNWTDK